LKLDGKSIIWPANIDSTKTRKEGRKLPKTIAVDSPKLSEIQKVSQDLGLNFEMVDDAARPNNWWEKTGYLIIERGNKSKSSLLKEISLKIKSKRPKSKK
jgi:signal recognition particle subunit SRP19